MIEITIHVHFGSGLVVRFPASWERKHFDRETMREAADEVASRLGGSVLFIEDNEDTK